jgi:hypothetical protein
MRTKLSTGCLLLSVIAGCSLSPYFENAPECAEGETRDRDLACGPCMTGTATDVCSPTRQWTEVQCTDSSDEDGDGFPNFECVLGEAIDCNDADPLAFPGATGLEECIIGETQPCTTSCGTPSTRPCTAACRWGACVECVPGESTDCTTTCGSTGRATCTAACVPPTDCAPPTETCNSVDDDCDTETDNGFPCTPGEAVSCTTTCGSSGVGECTASCGPPTGTACRPPTETCNGGDDDCDAVCDNGVGACCRESNRPCMMPGGEPGIEVCSGSCTWGTCTSETCNGRDDDLDGLTDEDWPTLGERCDGTDEDLCEDGTVVCGADGLSATCREVTPAGRVETCDGVDNDCDTTTDTDMTGATCRLSQETSEDCGACGGHRTSSCSTPSCTWGDFGACSADAYCSPGDTDETGCTGCAGASRSCSSACRWNDCVNPPETCNGVDDDCDTRVDEDVCGTCRAERREGYHRDYLICPSPGLFWQEARDQCVLWGYDLVIIEDAWEKDYLRALIGGFDYWWIGLRNRAGVNYWVDDTAATYFPSGGIHDGCCCFFLHRVTDGFNDSWCDRPMAFICEKEY